MIEVINGGPLSTIQDLGRFGVMKTGFTQSGVMDSHSAKLANTLCGNSLNAPVIEMTMFGVTVKFKEERIFAVTGADMGAKLNGEPIKRNKAYQAKTDDTLSLGAAVNGMRGYLAVAGGFKADSFMGSCSTNLKIGVGGYQGRKLRAGDKLECGEAKIFSVNHREVPENRYSNSVSARVVLGPQDDMFTPTDIELFSKQHYTVTKDMDRMGIRLCGIALKGKDGMDIISDGIVFGSIQITRSGQPIILMADHQTTGGYAKIATVISVDLPLLAQLRPFDILHFDVITAEKSEKLALKEKKYFENLR
ncbi:MAG: biotin-dependent carboxyltransferase family protein [Clostridiales bacterium]|nr:biotin-dependent carboxyltransferase family protein [Clostridiales bacterium]